MNFEQNKAFDAICQEVRNERERQIDKWGDQQHSPIEWLPILMEEVGEVSREVLENYYQKDFPKQIQTNPNDWQNYEKELIQVAAVVFSMLENLKL